MKYFIISRGDELSNQIQTQLEQTLHLLNFIIDPAQPDIAISVGGDGTLLETFHRYTHCLQETAFLGVHTGHLGFYADWRPDEIEELIDMLDKSALTTVSYPLLKLTVHHEDEGKRKSFLALNECTVKSRTGSLVVNIEINGDHFETFRGDGLCFSTPTGSTAYNKSLGGAIIHPSLCVLQMAEMASINNRVYRTIGSPLVLPQHHSCELKLVNDKDYLITVDHLTIGEKNVGKIKLEVAKEKVRFARYRPFPFWMRVKEAFI